MNTRWKHPVLVLLSWSKGHRGAYGLAVVLAVAGVACGLVPYFAAAAIVTGLLSGQGELAPLMTWCAVAAVGYLLKVVFGNASTAIAHRAAFETIRTVRTALVAKYERMPLGTVLDTPSGQVKNLVVDKVEGLESPLAHLIPEATANILVPVALIVYLFVLNWGLALATLAVLPLGMMFMGSMMKDYQSQYEGCLAAKGRMNAAVVEYVDGIKVIKAFCRSGDSYRTYHDAVVSNASHYYEWMKSCQWSMAGYMVVCPATLLTVLPIGCIFMMNGFVDAAQFATIVILAMSVMGPLLALTSFTDALATMGTVVGDVRAVLDAPELVRPQTGASLTSHDIALQGVRFSYGEGQEVLHGVDLTIPAGGVTALVGASGSGKSTIARLIAGFWDPDAGTVSIGGHSLTELSQAQVSALVAFVDQHSYLFDGTVMDNIRMGRPNATDDEVRRVAQAAGCDDFIGRLAQGYDTPVGAGGLALSGGERQRVAIARAMLHDAPIVVLDESTAFVDPESEAQVQRAVTQLVAGRTLVVVAHRLSSVRDADQIVVVDNGTLAAVGTHETLLNTCPRYQDLWEAHLASRDGEQEQGGEAAC